MNKGYIIVDRDNRYPIKEKLTHFAIGGERENVSNALSLIIGVFPVYYNGVIYCHSSNPKWEAVNSFLRDEASRHSCRLDNDPDFVMDYIASSTEQDIEYDDIFYSAKEGELDIDTSNPNDWVLCDFEIPVLYTDVDYQNLDNALRQACGQFNLMFLEQ